MIDVAIAMALTFGIVAFHAAAGFVLLAPRHREADDDPEVGDHEDGRQAH